MPEFQRCQKCNAKMSISRTGLCVTCRPKTCPYPHCGKKFMPNARKSYCEKHQAIWDMNLHLTKESNTVKGWQQIRSISGLTETGFSLAMMAGFLLITAVYIVLDNQPFFKLVIRNF